MTPVFPMSTDATGVGSHHGQSEAKLNILLVDDDRVDYIATKRLLRTAYQDNFNLTWIENPETFLTQLSECQYDVCLIDYRMGNINGIEIIQEAHEAGYRDLAIIMLTGMADLSIDLKATEAGATDFLIKNELSSTMLERSIRYSIHRKETEKKIRYLAFHDVLTGLANRTLFNDHLERSISSCARHLEYASVLFIDLDNFKSVNDSLGHSIGDKVLIEISRRLSDNIRSEDILSRFGGDEFVLLLNRLGSNKSLIYPQIKQFADKLIDVINQPIQIDGINITMTGSIGASVFGHELVSPDTILKQSDIAMYRTKSDGKNGISFFETEMEEMVLSGYWVEQDLPSAIKDQQLELYYQPIIDIQATKVRGAEALIRWNHPERGFIPPNDFIDKAEESDLICSIGQYVLLKGCEFLSTNPDLQYLSVNIGKRHFESDDFVADLQTALNATNIDPSRLVIELTERIYLKDKDKAREKMLALKKRGIRIALDDFGTGYSSLAVLKHLPFDILKIDGEFISDINNDSVSDAILRAIIAMSEALGLDLIAEGLEDKAQIEFMREVQCFSVQGYYFSKPLCQSNFRTFVENWKQRQR